MISIHPFIFQEGKVEETFLVEYSVRNGTHPDPLEHEINMPALISVVAVSVLILVLGLIKHILHRVNRPEGNIFNGYIVDVELVRHSDTQSQSGGQQGVDAIYDPRIAYNDEPPSYEAIQLELPSYEEIMKKE